MTVKEINKEWGGKFIKTFNMMDAAIVFALAVTKEGKVRVCATTDVTPPELKKLLTKVISTL